MYVSWLCRTASWVRSSFLCRHILYLGEAALLISQRVVHTELTLNSLLHATAATVTLNKTFTIFSIYLTPCENISKPILEKLIDQLPRPFLLVGDFNAHSPWVGGLPAGWSGEVDWVPFTRYRFNLFKFQSPYFYTLTILPQQLTWLWLHPPLHWIFNGRF